MCKNDTKQYFMEIVNPILINLGMVDHLQELNDLIATTGNCDEAILLVKPLALEALENIGVMVDDDVPNHVLAVIMESLFNLYGYGDIQTLNNIVNSIELTPYEITIKLIDLVKGVDVDDEDLKDNIISCEYASIVHYQELVRLLGPAYEETPEESKYKNKLYSLRHMFTNTMEIIYLDLLTKPYATPAEEYMVRPLIQQANISSEDKNILENVLILLNED